MYTIPRIIHQVWYGKKSKVSPFLLELSDTWKVNHPEWRYEFWDRRRIDAFINKYYPEFIDFFKRLANDQERQNAVSYMILFRRGGLCVKLDYECIESIDRLLGEYGCYLSVHSECDSTDNQLLLTDALILSDKKNDFIRYILDHLTKVDSMSMDREKRISETTGCHFITELYKQYPYKEKIHIFLSTYTAPFCPWEIRAFFNDLILDEEMEDKLTDAVAFRYHLLDGSENYDNISNKNVDILYLSTFVGGGGAPIAAYRIHSGLRNLGVNSIMLTLRSSLEQREDICVVSSTEKQDNDGAPLSKYPKASPLFSTAVAGVDVSEYVQKIDPRIVQLHFINRGLVSIEELTKIQKKIVWRLPDCWAFTGGCYYFGECEKYKKSCGACPQLGSDIENDLSREIWQRKERAWKQMDITVVVPTLWMKDVAQKSSLFMGRNIHVIPNGLDIDKFSPFDKKMARKLLKLPFNKKLILFGAANALNDPRKGFQFLLKALQILSDKYGDEYHLLIFGSDVMELDLKISVTFLGYIREHFILQMAYSAADVMIVPSIEEAFGQTVIEAMACATPVVAFRETGPEGIIEHLKTGYLATFKSVDDLATGIEWTLRNEQHTMLLSENARHRVEETFDIRIIAKQYKSLYDRILNNK